MLRVPEIKRHDSCTVVSKDACFPMPEQDCFERRSTVLVHLIQSRLNSGTRVATIDIIDSIVLLVSRTVLFL